MHIKPILLVLTLVFVSGCSTSRTALNEQQAHVLAEKLATEKYGWIVGGGAFQNSRPPHFEARRWVWRWTQGASRSDVEVSVSFDADGSLPVVDWLAMTSEEYVPRR